MADEWKWVIGIISVIVIVMVFTGHLKGNVMFQSVVGTDCPLFKTNAVGGYPNGYYANITWVAADCNGDGVYEAYGYKLTSASPDKNYAMKGKTPENYDYYCSGTSLWVWDTTLPGPYMGNPYPYAVFSKNYGASVNADLTCGACTPIWSCTTWTICSSGVQTRTCTDSNNCGVTTGKPIESQTCTIASAFVCDSNSDGNITKQELLNTLQKYITG